MPPTPDLTQRWPWGLSSWTDSPHTPARRTPSFKETKMPRAKINDEVNTLIESTWMNKFFAESTRNSYKSAIRKFQRFVLVNLGLDVIGRIVRLTPWTTGRVPGTWSPVSLDTLLAFAYLHLKFGALSARSLVNYLLAIYQTLAPLETFTENPFWLEKTFLRVIKNLRRRASLEEPFIGTQRYTSLYLSYMYL